MICDRDTVSDHGSERSRLVTRTTEVTHAATVPRAIVTSFWLELPESGRLRWNATTLLESALTLDWRPDSGHPAGFLDTLYWNHFSLSRDRIPPRTLVHSKNIPPPGNSHCSPAVGNVGEGNQIFWPPARSRYTTSGSGRRAVTIRRDIPLPALRHSHTPPTTANSIYKNFFFFLN